LTQTAKIDRSRGRQCLIAPLLTLLIIAALLDVALAAQEPERAGVSIALETTRDRWHYRFENPSSFGTAELVPHEFTQTYWGDNQWVVVRGQFNLSRKAQGRPRLFEAEIAATPPKTTRGDDYDTFFQPSGDVVVAGTTGHVSMQSWRANGMIGIGRAGGLDWGVGYEYRRDRSIFGPGNKTITHTQPASLESSVITTRETTVSQMYGLTLRATRRWTGDSWSVALGVDAAPASRARLLTLLPDKYPGMDIVFSTLANEVRPSISVCLGRHHPISVTAAYTRSARYKRSAELERSAASVSVGLGWNK